MDDFNEDIGMRILSIRMLYNMSREQFSERIGISSKFLYEIEKGKKGFSCIVLYRICIEFNVDCNYLLTGNTYNGYDTRLLEIIKKFDGKQCIKLIKVLDDISDLLSN